VPPDIPREFIPMKTYVKDDMIVGELGENFEPWLKQKRQKDPKKYAKVKTAIVKTAKPDAVIRNEPLLYSSGPSDASSVEDDGGDGDLSMDDDLVEERKERDFDEIVKESEDEDERPVRRKKQKARKYDLVLDESEDMDF
jgi:hypothetical protein